ncbi:MAG: hypothetical protein DCC67_13765 [Planctomycetota bacterium]|nr:MAG: hypothetical protein DCC67_13765 [Planctomycetota bacterium]
MATTTRRDFMRRSATLGSLAGLGELGFLAGLAPVSAEETRVERRLQLEADIEPLVRWIEETPRERLIEEAAARIRSGLSYRDLLAGLLLAGVKNIEPRPSVGFKFHAVLVVNSAHLASMASPAEHRWLPIFWALDYYKSAAQRDVEERGDWTMQPVDESALPPASKAPRAFVQAMDDWDEPAADAAAARLARSGSAGSVFELLFRYGMRDFRSIGHKAIYVANALRTLNCIGWRHAEPVLRSLAYALLAHEGDNPAKRDADADRPYRRNQQLVENVRPDWLDGDPSDAAAAEALAALRSGSNDEACDLVAETLNRGASPQSIWDALHLAAGELLMRQPGIVALHAMTTTNALRHAYETSSDPRTRLLLMLQNAAFLPMFRGEMENRGGLKEHKIDELAAAEADEPPAIDAIFAELGRDRDAASRMILRRVQAPEDATEIINAARVLTFLKGNDAHDYKFSSAALEDYGLVSPHWRDRYLAASAYHLCHSQEPDNALVERTRAAFTS